MQRLAIVFAAGAVLGYTAGAHNTQLAAQAEENKSAIEQGTPMPNGMWGNNLASVTNNPQGIMLTARDQDGDASYPIVDKHHYVICSPEVPSAR